MDLSWYWFHLIIIDIYDYTVFSENLNNSINICILILITNDEYSGVLGSWIYFIRLNDLTQYLFDFRISYIEMCNKSVIFTYRKILCNICCQYFEKLKYFLKLIYLEHFHMKRKEKKSVWSCWKVSLWLYRGALKKIVRCRLRWRIFASLSTHSDQKCLVEFAIYAHIRLKHNEKNVMMFVRNSFI